MTWQEGLDFIIIGAMKSGTTTLFEYLREHPRLYLPPEKELPIFNGALSQGEYREFMQRHYSSATNSQLLGKVTPHYMLDACHIERIRRMDPDVRLIAILRDPVERAYSHYRMLVRRSLETETFDDLAKQWARHESPDEPGYFRFGEYGRLLSPIAESFHRDQLLILYTEDLHADPQRVLDAVTAFVGVPALQPSTPGLVSHVGGTRQRVPFVRAISRSMPGRLARRIVPKQTLQRFRYRFNMWNAVPDPVDRIPLAPTTLSDLQQRYRQDAEVLNASGYSAPWRTRWSDANVQTGDNLS